MSITIASILPNVVEPAGAWHTSLNLRFSVLTVIAGILATITVAVARKRPRLRRVLIRILLISTALLWSVSYFLTGLLSVTGSNSYDVISIKGTLFLSCAYYGPQEDGTLITFDYHATDQSAYRREARAISAQRKYLGFGASRKTWDIRGERFWIYSISIPYWFVLALLGVLSYTGWRGGVARAGFPIDNPRLSDGGDEKGSHTESITRTNE